MTQPKPHYKFSVVAGRPVSLPSRESPIDAARRRYGKPFAHESGSPHIHTEGPSYWTIERVAQLAADNERIRRNRK